MATGGESIMARLDQTALQNSVNPGTVVVASTGLGAFDQIMLDGRHAVRADEPRRPAAAMAGPILTSCC